MVTPGRTIVPQDAAWGGARPKTLAETAPQSGSIFANQGAGPTTPAGAPKTVPQSGSLCAKQPFGTILRAFNAQAKDPAPGKW